MFSKPFHHFALALVIATGTVGAAAVAPQSAEARVTNLQCVPYARQLSGVQIYGDARTWWKQAAGKYARGGRPQKGAV
ncbi:MAG: CHAP domain-containing protein, partial [Marinomonas sp.]